MAAAAPLYEPSEWGAKFSLLPHHEALGAGAAGPGKSLVLLWEPLAQMTVEHERTVNRKHPHYHGGESTGWALHLRRISPMLETSIQRSKRLFKAWDPGAKWQEQKMTWEFSSGYRYQFGHCAENDDWDRYLSAEFTIICYDELVQFNEEQYKQINTRLRSTDPVLKDMLKIRAMSNPVMRKGIRDDFAVNDPQWVRKYFVEPAPEGNETLRKVMKRADGTRFFRDRIYLPAKLRHNPDPEFVKQYEETLLDSPPHIRNALLYGDWFITEGSYFGAVWNKQRHVCVPFRVPSDWPMFRSMDWGFQTQGCVHWYTLDPEGTVFVIKEYSFRKKTADVVAEEVRAIEKDLGVWGKNNKSRITGPADTQLWEQRGERGKSKAQEFFERGVPWTRADKKSRQRNAERVSQLLDTHDGVRDPRLVIFNNCPKLIGTLPAIQMMPKKPEEPADGGDDHWVDSLFYGAAYASRGRSFVGGRDEDEDDFDREVEARQERSYGYGSMV
jgi:phage terminase large subunit